MSSAFAPRPFGHTPGRTDTMVSPLGLGSSYGLSGEDVERAFERGVNFFLWGSRRRASFGEGLRRLAQAHRSEMVVAIQTYTRFPSLMEGSVDRALRRLHTGHVDILCLAWWNGPPPPRIIEAAVRLRDRGKVGRLMVSCHHRPNFEVLAQEPSFDALMVRYNAAHPGAEREVFPHLARRRPGVVAFTATRWGTLLDRRHVPEGEPLPRASDCYRFALSNPEVSVCLAGPKDGAELDEALEAVARGPMSPDELAWMRRVGAHVRASTKKPSRISVLDLFDRMATLSPCGSKQLTSGS
jgi:aryl-alcohol dehydrogenase-like predicted oxidoreductase